VLEHWLANRVNASPAGIKLGLERILSLASKLNLLHWSIPVIVIGGTNGKGSTIAALEAIYQKAGYRTLMYTSPHIVSFNERIRLDGIPISDDRFKEAVYRIEALQGDTRLTFFEWATLAALLTAKDADLDVLLLEVGLGGRLDAVNIVESDLAIITSIALDHMEYLGPTRESIAKEKAGIMRSGKPVIFGDCSMPEPIKEQASRLSAPLSRYFEDYFIDETETGWVWKNSTGLTLKGSQPLSLKANNIATALQACYLMQKRLPVSAPIQERAIDELTLPGRIQCFQESGREWVFDVSHNPQAVEYLSAELQLKQTKGKTWALFAALASKDVANMLKPMERLVDHWLLPQLQDPRAMMQESLQKMLTSMGCAALTGFSTTKEALAHFYQFSSVGDRCVVFGSFVLLGEVQIAREVWKHENNS
jgi:dihydrofolate synthase/folylpolyglutamate synthase